MCVFIHKSIACHEELHSVSPHPPPNMKLDCTNCFVYTVLASLWIEISSLPHHTVTGKWTHAIFFLCRQTHTDTHINTDTHRHTQTHTDTHTHRHTDTHTHTHTHTQHIHVVQHFIRQILYTPSTRKHTDGAAQSWHTAATVATVHLRLS